jgi:hypothetical protein
MYEVSSADANEHRCSAGNNWSLTQIHFKNSNNKQLVFRMSVTHPYADIFIALGSHVGSQLQQQLALMVDRIVFTATRGAALRSREAQRVASRDR